jgi:DNA polymerase-3 subunit delta
VSKDNLFFIYGEEPFFIDKKRSEITSQYIKTDSDKFNLERFEGASLDLKRLKSSVMSMPMMSEKRVVIINGLEVFFKGKIAKATKDAWAGFINDIPDFTVLVIDARLDKKKLSSFPWKDLITASVSHHYPLLRFEKIDSAIKDIAKGKDLSIDSQIVQYLKNRYDSDFMAISLELDKLMNYAPDKNGFTFEDASELLDLDKKYNLNELTRSLERRDNSSAVEIVLGLLKVGVALPFVLATMKNFYLSLFKYYEASNRFSQKNEIASNTGVPPFFLNGIISASRKYNLTDVENIIESLLVCEFRLKSQPTSHNNLFIDTVAKVLKA